MDMFLTAFTAGLLLITLSELGDKSFFIALCLAMRHRRRWVFAGSVAALALMTILSVLLGRVIALLPSPLTHWGTIAVFLGFGLKLLYDASQMPQMPDCAAEAEALATVTNAPIIAKSSPVRVISQTFVMTFFAEWGDRTQFATITLAAVHPPGGVAIGAILGHAVCSMIAVFSGRFVAGHLSERVITAMGGALFLLFALVTGWEGMSHPGS
jgi:putative Ca2+/H+ antiporter (TMEM165/GDT1 family)